MEERRDVFVDECVCDCERGRKAGRWVWACGVEEAGRYRAGDRCGVWPWRLEPNVCVFVYY